MIKTTQKEKAHIIFTTAPLDLPAAMKTVVTPKNGGVVSFLGVVRDYENGSPIASIGYDFYSAMAEKEMKNVIQQTTNRWPVGVVVHHRLGRVPVGEASLLVVCAAAHRKEAFEACQFVVDEIKKNVPIWKVKYEWIQ